MKYCMSIYNKILRFFRAYPESLHWRDAYFKVCKKPAT